MVNFVDVLTRLGIAHASMALLSLLQKFEKKGICDQLQRAVVSISSNIAEGAAKPSDVEFAHYLDTALGSAFEVETQLIISNNIGYLKNDNANYQELIEGIKEIERQLNGLISTVRKS